MKTIFIMSLLFILYTYFGYPLYLLVRSKIYPKPIDKKYNNRCPFVSILIAAKNEVDNIESRIANLLEIEYPPDRFEIIVVSDGSDDNTNQIVEQYAASNNKVHLIAYHTSQGKPTALNCGAENAKGEIIIFADSRQRFDKRAVTELVANFSDPDIGCVSGELVFVEGQDSTIVKEMGAYWRYEKMVRKLESLGGSVAGATGAIYAIRKALYQNIPAETILDDVLIPMNIVMQGHRCVFDPLAIAYDVVSKDIQFEMTRKIRTLAGNWQLLQLSPELASPLRNPIWWGFFSHKIFRLLVPMTLVLLLVTNLFLTGLFFAFTLLSQVLFYAVAAFAHVSNVFRNNRLAKLIYFFVNLNWAALQGTWFFLSGKVNLTWKRST